MRYSGPSTARVEWKAPAAIRTTDPGPIGCSPFREVTTPTPERHSSWVSLRACEWSDVRSPSLMRSSQRS